MSVNPAHIGLVAICKAKPDRLEETRKELMDAVEWSRAEEGCVEYLLHIDRDNTNEFVFYEVWKDQAALESHNSRPEFTALIAKLDDLLTEPATVILLERIA